MSTTLDGKAERQEVVEEVFEKDGVWGSVIHNDGDKQYSDDYLLEFREWLDKQIERIPPHYRASARIEVDSVGGYEGEHHAKVRIYYLRQETDAELKDRLDEERKATAKREREERARFAELKKKYG